MATDGSDSIIEWYRNQVVFITGGTGFLGKALIFKLLQVGCLKIYVLVRPKRGKTVRERLDTILDEEIFDSIRAVDPLMKSRVFPISGEVTHLGFGLSNDDRKVLTDNVTAVFHIAASVKFDDELREAVFTNLRSTREVVELAKKMKHLKILAHVSTAYSNCDHMMCDDRGILEKVYQRKMDWRKLIEFVETAPREVINAVTMKVLGASPNTYIFTKHLAESVIEDASYEIPVVISRPAVVVPAMAEPYPGWMDNISSPVSISGATAKGLLRVTNAPVDSLTAYVPCDFSTNSLMVCAWRQANFEDKVSPTAPVYNVDYSPLDIGNFSAAGLEAARGMPPHNAMWTPILYFTNNRHMFLFLHLLLHILPGVFFETILKVMGRADLRLLKIYRRLYHALVCLNPIMNLPDNFDVKNNDDLREFIPLKEKPVFPLAVTMTHRQWVSYIAVCASGWRKFINEPPTPSKMDFIMRDRLIWANRALCAVLWILFFWILPPSTFLLPVVYVFNAIGAFIASL